jgi:hypothetical protein
MKIRSQKDFASGILMIAVGTIFAIGATNYNFGASVRPGPGYFPFGLGIPWPFSVSSSCPGPSPWRKAGTTTPSARDVPAPRSCN